jgi:hypothetical protein
MASEASAVFMLLSHVVMLINSWAQSPAGQLALQACAAASNTQIYIATASAWRTWDSPSMLMVH